jgi:hypothetical protein
VVIALRIHRVNEQIDVRNDHVMAAICC